MNVAALTALVAKDQQSAAKARALWPGIASRMALLRQDYLSDNEFGAALLLRGMEYSRADREAFLWMGSLPEKVLADALKLCDHNSPALFRAEVIATRRSTWAQ
jgi:hypothetical protein